MFVTTATIEPPSYMQTPRADERLVNSISGILACNDGSPSPSTSTALAKFNKIIDESMPTTNYYNYYNNYNSATTSSLSSASILSKQLSIASGQQSLVKSSICTVQPRLSVTTSATAPSTNYIANDIKQFDRKFSGNMDNIYENAEGNNLSINLNKPHSNDNQTKRNDVHYLLKQLNSFSDIEEIAIVDLKNTNINICNASMLSNTSPLTTTAQQNSKTLSTSSSKQLSKQQSNQSLQGLPSSSSTPSTSSTVMPKSIMKKTPSTSSVSSISLGTSIVSQPVITTTIKQQQQPLKSTKLHEDSSKTTGKSDEIKTTITTSTTSKSDKQNKFKLPSYRQKSTIKSCHNSSKHKTVFEIELNTSCKEPTTTTTTTTTTCAVTDIATPTSVFSSTKSKQQTQITTATTTPPPHPGGGSSEKQHKPIYGHQHSHEFRLSTTSCFSKKQQPHRSSSGSGESPTQTTKPQSPGAVTTVVYSTTTRMSGDVIQTEILRSCDSPTNISSGSSSNTGSNNSLNKRSKTHSKRSSGGAEGGMTTSISISNSYIVQDETTKTSSFFKCCYTPLDRWRERRNSNSAASAAAAAATAAAAAATPTSSSSSSTSSLSNNGSNNSIAMNTSTVITSSTTPIVVTVTSNSKVVVTSQNSITTILSGNGSVATTTTIAENGNSNGNGLNNSNINGSNNSNNSSNASMASPTSKNNSNSSVHGDAV